MRERIEAGFERFGRVAVRRRYWVIALVLAFTAGLAVQLPNLGMETAVDKFLDEDDPARILFNEFRDQFGRGEMTIIAVHPPDVFDAGFLRKLQRLHREIEQTVPYVEEVTSMVNARATYGSENELIVEDLLEHFPETDAQLEKLRERVLANPFYRNTMISEDGTFTTILVRTYLYDQGDDLGDALAGFEEDFAAAPTEESARPDSLTGQQLGETIRALEEICERYRADDFELSMAGTPVVQHHLAAALGRDMPRFMGLMILTIGVVLFLLFRRASGVFLPLLVVILSVVATLGSMAASGTYLSTPSQILPTFLLAVGTGATVHILKIFYLRFDAGDSVEDAMAFAMGHSGLPVLMATLTTAGGLLSFLAAKLTPIVDLGLFAPLGIMLALGYCLVLLPALVAALPLRRRAAASDEEAASALDRGIMWVGDLSATHPWTVVGLIALIAAGSFAGALRVTFSNDVLGWLSPHDPLHAATLLIDEELRGSVTLEVLVDTGRQNGVKDPDFLNSLEQLEGSIGRLTRGDYLYVGKTIAITDVVREIHKALNENRSEFYSIPQDPELVSQELLLFENSGSDDLNDFVDAQFQLARFTLKVPYTDPKNYDGFIDDVQAEFDRVLPDHMESRTTGFMGMMGRTMVHVINGMARSYLLAFAIITPLMILLIGNLRGGLVSMVPNLSPILLTLGVMGWAGLTIDMFTMMIGGIAIGVAVDDTIHFIHGFRRYYGKHGDARAAVRETLATTGRALLVTSVVLATGFLTFGLSEMENLYYFGVLTSFTIATAFLLDITVTPALMVLVTPKRESAG